MLRVRGGWLRALSEDVLCVTRSHVNPATAQGLRLAPFSWLYYRNFRAPEMFPVVSKTHSNHHFTVAGQAGLRNRFIVTLCHAQIPAEILASHGTASGLKKWSPAICGSVMCVEGIHDQLFAQQSREA